MARHGPSASGAPTRAARGSAANRSRGFFLQGSRSPALRSHWHRHVALEPGAGGFATRAGRQKDSPAESAMKERFRLLPGGPLIGEAQILAYVDGQLPPRER